MGWTIRLQGPVRPVQPSGLSTWYTAPVGGLFLPAAWCAIPRFEPPWGGSIRGRSGSETLSPTTGRSVHGANRGVGIGAPPPGGLVFGHVGGQFGGIPGLRPGPPARQQIRKCLCLGGFVGPAGSLDLGVWDQQIRPNAQGKWAQSGKMPAWRRAGAILHPPWPGNF